MVDIIVIGLIAFSILVSLWRGFTSEVLSLAGWVVAFFVASGFYPYLSSYLTQVNSVYLQNSEYLRNGVAAAVLFILTLIVCGIITALLSKLIDTTGLSATDRVLGGAFGALRGILIVAAILFFLDTFSSASQTELWKESQLIPHFDFIVKWFFEQLQANSSFLNSTK
ncbi:CvpA family protein [Actinobacillus pleuropneumoniae]|uniref:Colicin V synthesis protein n=1 Tax=Actinobacillus pleuropneumoniae TaxID=715 RepID=A0ABM6X1B4_ACTPL|nr:CvpA family protein [Actinobacillus pleuropneumoniae]ASU16370.1 Colicin V production protein [Actinobacillus pleuropneumoniae]AWG94842.1 colicin V synthesis protein [Actinobacillus pleuropneumoniae serovar 1 str. 4074]AXA20915.1 colicin V synthesis protein [Actinobacillus pleuropneumoniae]EFM94852.1 Colicin V production protein [Actinobacillus pleuropneumoniae serovar 9 str. CVJ13261]EFM99178.1 Colicin V production protein [Actinobacillus pleuropneumoniae serovar 11 str. 56153]